MSFRHSPVIMIHLSWIRPFLLILITVSENSTDLSPGSNTKEQNNVHLELNDGHFSLARNKETMPLIMTNCAVHDNKKKTLMHRCACTVRY